MKTRLRTVRMAPAMLATIGACLLAVSCLVASASAFEPQIEVAANHSCAISETGVLYCFGLNDSGQLGNATGIGTSDDFPTPTAVPLGGPATHVSGYLNHTCAVLADGTVKCFGGNNAGQLGSTLNSGTSTPVPTPQTVPLAGPAADISTGQYFSCALLQSGAVQCWGTNQYGSLGVATNAGTVNPNPTPQTVVLAGPALAFDAGVFDVCASLATGAVQCWGENFAGTLGNATNNGNFNVNLPLNAGLTGTTTALSLGGGSQSCALKSDATAECFGQNQYGQIARAANVGTQVANPTPATVPLGGAPVRQVSSGGDFGCALLTSGGVSCWGNNYRGQLGSTLDNGTSVAHITPAAVAGLAEPAIRISTGYNSVCAILQSGAVQCWGNNGGGQLGQPGTGMFTSPTLVPGLSLFDAPPSVTKKSLKLSKPKLKYKKSGRKLLVTSTVSVKSSAGTLSASECTGKLKAVMSAKVKNKKTGRRKTKRYASKSFAMTFSKQTCAAKLKLKLAKSTAGKKLTLTLSFAGNATVDPYAKSFLEKIKRVR